MSKQRILVAVDLSGEARQVLDAAKSIAGGDGASLSCITVLKPLTGMYGGIDMAPYSGGYANFEVQAVEIAREQMRELAGAYNIPSADTHIRLGSPGAEIKALAEAMTADLIVIGTHGQHGLGLLLGSTANNVLHGVPCDVLVVRIKD